MRFRKVAVGGTFDTLHKGHKALLTKAFELGGTVVIGLMSDAAVILKRVQQFSERKRSLEDFLQHKNYEIVKLNDFYGPAARDSEIEALVVSEETAERAAEINEIRRKSGIAPVEIVVIPLVLAEDGKPISSTRVRRGEIDREGSLLS